MQSFLTVVDGATVQTIQLRIATAAGLSSGWQQGSAVRLYAQDFLKAVRWQFCLVPALRK